MSQSSRYTGVGLCNYNHVVNILQANETCQYYYGKL